MIIANDAPLIAAVFEILAQPNVEKWCNGRKFCVSSEHPEGLDYWQLMTKLRKLHEHLKEQEEAYHKEVISCFISPVLEAHAQLNSKPDL